MLGFTLPNFKQENLGGLKIAAIYGIKPHLLGFCGPQERSATQYLLRYLSGQKIAEKKIREIFKGFEGAYSYYKLIARCNRIKDPFDERVVKSYWIGNNFLEKVPTKAFKEMVVEEFSRPGLLPKKIAAKQAKKIPAGSKPHHSFHVLRIGSITGRVKLRGKLLDLCRVGWGKVIAINLSQSKIKVKFKPLKIGKKYRLGKIKEKYIIWNRNLLPQPKLGQYISFHWNLAAQILTKKDLTNLQKYTQETLTVLNAIS